MPLHRKENVTGWKTGKCRQKTVRARTRTKNSQVLVSSPGFVPRPHWWDAGVLLTFHPSFPLLFAPLERNTSSPGIWKCWREKGRTTQRKISLIKAQTNRKLGPHMTLGCVLFFYPVSIAASVWILPKPQMC